MSIAYADLTREDLIRKIEEISKKKDSPFKERRDISRNSTVNAIDLGRWRWDVNNDKVVFNEKKVAILGYSTSEIPKDVDSKFFTSKLHPDDYNMVTDNMRNHMSGKTKAYEVEYRIKAKTGEYKWYYDRGVVVKRDNNSKPLMIEGVVFDITNRKLQQAKNDLLTKLPLANPDIVIIMNINGQVEYINPSGQKAIKKNIFEMLPKDFISKLVSSYNSNQLKTINYSLENFDYTLKIRPFAGDKQCMVTVSDITEIVKIKKEKNLYYEALQSVNQPMFISDSKGKIININKAFERLYGYSQNDVIGQNPKILSSGKEAYLNLGYAEKEYEDLFSDMWTSITDPDIGTWEGTVINRNKDGNIMWINLKTNAIIEDGKIVNYISLPIDITNSVASTNHAKHDLYQAIASLAEMRDNETGAHMRRVGIYSKLIAKELGFRQKLCDDIEIFAPMHDLGKVGIPDSILLAERNLTEEEFEIMKNHAVFGYNIASKTPDMSMVAQVAYGHHEKYDGTGYPQSLKGEDIPIVARIVALVDVYDALRSKRPYKEEWSHKDAMAYIVKSRGSHFDPKIVDIFVELNEAFNDVYNEVVDIV
jgi:PAS domain S-box-containing protein